MHACMARMREQKAPCVCDAGVQFFQVLRHVAKLREDRAAGEVPVPNAAAARLVIAEAVPSLTARH